MPSPTGGTSDRIAQALRTTAKQCAVAFDWIRPKLFWLLCGVLLGAFLRLPLIRYTLDEATGTIVATAVSAGLAVLGASWIATSDRRRAGHELSRMLLGRAKIVADEVGALDVYLRPPLSPGSMQFAQLTCAALQRVIADMRDELLLFSPSFIALGPSALRHQAGMNDLLDAMDAERTAIEQQLGAPGAAGGWPAVRQDMLKNQADTLVRFSENFQVA